MASRVVSMDHCFLDAMNESGKCLDCGKAIADCEIAVWFKQKLKQSVAAFDNKPRAK